MIDIYCERTGPEFWSEPVNAATNAAFFLAAYAAFAAARSEGIASREVKLLCVLVAIVGSCSFAFHTLATRWAGALDSLSILAFVLTYVFLFSRRVLAVSPVTAFFFAAFVPVLMFVGGGILRPFGIPGGGYLGFVIVALALGAAVSGQARAHLWTVAGFFSISFGFRTLDGPLCEMFPLGTHFLWHILNATVCYLAIRGFSLGSVARGSQTR